MNIVISGPGGAGKGTLVERLLERRDDLWLSRSWTTRARRPGEREDAYVFCDRATFDANIERGGFLEWVDFLDYRQGTPIPDVPAGSHAVFEIDVAGARAIRDWDADAVLIFVDTPDPDEQRRRLEARGDDADHVRQRLRKADEEREAARELGMHRIVNDDLPTALDRLDALIDEASKG